MINHQEDTHLFSEAHCRLAMQVTGVGMWDWDIVHDKQFWSKECRAILGVSPEAEASFAHFMTLVHPDDQARVREQLAENLHKHVEQDVTYRVIWPDGSVHWVTSKRTYLYDANGQVVRLLGIVFDMTIQKEASDELVRELEHQQAFLRAIVEQAPSGLVIAEAPSGGVTFFNEQASKMLGQEVVELRGIADYTRYRVLHLDGIPYKPEEYPLARALLTGEVVTGEEMLFHQRDGKLSHFSANAAPVYNAQREMLAGVLTFYDTTERYELERKKDEFITMASHELRTPLTSLRGNLQMAERRLKQLHEKGTSFTDSDGRSSLERLIIWIERALRQVKVESRLINDLLDATRIQAEKLHVELKPCDLTQIVRDAVNDVRVLAPTRSIDLSLPQQSAVCVQADSVRIGQVVSNYLTNALKYSAEHQPVSVGLELAGREARVWVKDAGPGLSPEARQAIWNRLYRLSTFAEYTGLGSGGLGLGLYINREIIRQHGGNVGVESTSGRGSTFWFTLPLQCDL